MKATVRFVFVFLLLLVTAYVLPVISDHSASNVREEAQDSLSINETPAAEEEIYPLPALGYEHYIGTPVNEYVARNGQPLRVGDAVDGSKWWIYEENENGYIQLNVDKGIILSIFVLGESVDTGTIKVGLTKENVYDETGLASAFEFQYNEAAYRLELTEVEYAYTPVIQFDNDTVVMMMFDPRTERIFGLYFLSYQALMQLDYYVVDRVEGTKTAADQSSLQLNEKTALENEQQLAYFIQALRQTNDQPQLSGDNAGLEGLRNQLLEAGEQRALFSDRFELAESLVEDKVEDYNENITEEGETAHYIYYEEEKNMPLVMLDLVLDQQKRDQIEHASADSFEIISKENYLVILLK